MRQPISVDKGTCRACGLCAKICPIPLITQEKDSGISFRPDRLPLCIGCGQCMAICPTKSIVVEGLSYERDFFDLPAGAQGEPPFTEMIRTRRAIRVFKDRPVPRELLEKVVEAIRYAPPGFTPVKFEIVVVQDTAVIRKALPEMIEFYDGLVKAMGNPIARFFIRREAGKEKFRMMDHHLVPLLKSRLPELKQGTEDTITRYAPAMILFHADRNAENYEEDIHIAVTYAFLAVHALGLGGSAMSIIPPAVERSPVLRKLFSIPDGHAVAGSIILGYPKYRYQRGIRRDLKGVTWI